MIALSPAARADIERWLAARLIFRYARVSVVPCNWGNEEPEVY